MLEFSKSLFCVFFGIVQILPQVMDVKIFLNGFNCNFGQLFFKYY